jgi:crossover junction endodeoxyribonuclease RusA
VTRSTTSRAADHGAQSPAGVPAAQGRRHRSATPPGGLAAARPAAVPDAPQPGTTSPSPLSVTAPSAAVREPSPATGTAARVEPPAVPGRGVAQDPGSVTGDASRTEPARIPRGTPDASVPRAGSAGRTFTIALPPGLALLNLNDRGHWAARYRRSQAIKKAAWALALQARIPRLERVSVTAEYQPPDRRHRDADNPVASVKAAIDGMVAAGCLPSDESPRYVATVTCSIGEPYPKGRLVLHLAELPALRGNHPAGVRLGAETPGSAS